MENALNNWFIIGIAEMEKTRHYLKKPHGKCVSGLTCLGKRWSPTTISFSTVTRAFPGTTGYSLVIKEQSGSQHRLHWFVQQKQLFINTTLRHRVLLRSQTVLLTYEWFCCLHFVFLIWLKKEEDLKKCHLISFISSGTRRVVLIFSFNFWWEINKHISKIFRFISI